MLKVSKLKNFTDERGSLTVLQDEVPFQIERVYWIHGKSWCKRGGHRHILNRQVLIAVQGEIHVTVIKHSIQSKARLSAPGEFLIIEPDDWHVMEFSDDGILLVVASHKFDQNDYIEEPLA